MSLISYNFCKGKFGCETFLKLINSCKPSIICLQECNNKIIDEIKNKTGCYYAAQPVGQQGFSSNFTLIHTKHNIKKIDCLDIEGVARDVLFISVKIDNLDLIIANLHLKSGRYSTDVRKVQINTILSYVEKNYNDKKLILTGDWNLSSTETNWPPEGWKNTKLVPTFRSENKRVTSVKKFNYPFDRIIYKGIVLRNFVVLNGEENSDHDIIACTFIKNYKIVHDMKIIDSEIIEEDSSCTIM